MCLVAIAIEASARFPLVIAANRDEFFARPTAALDWWTEPDADILAGRDLQGGGTWLGLSRGGRLALLTNVREPGRQDAQAPSRGAIVPLALRSDAEPASLQRRLVGAGHNGFNLITGDASAGRWWHVSNRSATPARLARGLHGLSNATLDTAWPKVLALKQRVADALAAARSREALADALFAALADREPAAEDCLPATGIGLDWERALSPAFISAPERGYGTRCSTLVVVERVPGRGSETLAWERSFGPGSAEPVGERRFVLPEWPPRVSATPA